VNSCDIYDVRFLKEIKKLMIIKQPDDFMFQWMDKGVPTLVRAVEVNWWLNEFDNHITSKQFRTYHTNIIFIQQLLNKSPSSLNKKSRTKFVREAILLVSKRLNNTPAVLKKNYTNTGLVDMYINKPFVFENNFSNGKTPHINFTNYLKQICT